MKKLIYLEDDEALSFITKRGLEKRGYEVNHFSDIDSLKENLKESLNKSSAEQQFDYALLDLKLGNQTSLQMIEEILKVNSDARIVILTGYGSIRTAVEAMRLGAINFLSKPSSINNIIDALENKQTNQTQLNNAEELEAPSLKKQEWEVIQQALVDNDGNISAAARQLKMHRRTLQRKLQKKQLSE